jgi:hypothetical protein
MKMDPKDQRNEAPLDASLEEDLIAIREILSDQDNQEPPSMLDQAVLNAARRDLTGKKRSPIRWISAFATASVLVLALTIVVQQKETSVPVGLDRIHKSNQSQEIDSEVMPQEKAPVVGAIDGVSGIREERAKEDIRQRSSMPSQNAPLKRKAEAELKKAESPVMTPALAPPAPSADFRDESVMDANSGTDSPATTVPLEEAFDEDNEQGQFAGQSRRSDSRVQEQEMAIEAAIEVDQFGLSPGSEKDSTEPWTNDPSAWIERLHKLKQNGQLNQLKLETEAFQTAYPDYPLPADLIQRAE